MNKEETQTDLGMVSIHHNAIASMASIAACEIEGVKSIATTFKSGILEMLGKKATTIKVDIDRNDQVTVTVPLIARYGFNIPDMANKVQENVRNALEKMTNLSVKDIDIKVVSIEKP